MFTQQFTKQLYTSLSILLILVLFLPTQSVFAEDEEVDDEATYHELTPPFVVNLQGSGKRLRFLQARIQVLAYGSKAIAAVQTHNAPVRDALISLLSSKKRTDINTTKKKKALQKEALEIAKKALKEETGRAQIEGLYFTNFVIQ